MSGRGRKRRKGRGVRVLGGAILVAVVAVSLLASILLPLLVTP